MNTRIFFLLAVLASMETFISCRKADSPINVERKHPTAVAGLDQVITLPQDTIVLDGRASGDADGEISSFRWTKVYGPQSFTLTAPNSGLTIAKNLQEGIYGFELKVTDNDGLTDYDTVVIMVQIPVAIVDCVIPGSTLAGIFKGAVVDARVTLCNEKFYFSDGATLDVFDPVSGITSRQTFATLRSHVVVTSYGNEVYIAGGYIYPLTTTSMGQGSTQVNIFNTVNNSWRETRLTAPRFAGEASVAGSKIFFAGGRIDPYTFSRRIDIYDVYDDWWTYKDLEGSGEIIPVVKGRQVWFFTAGSNQLEIYDEQNDAWSSKTLKEEAGGHRAVTQGDKIYFTGEQDVKVYDVSNETWSQIQLLEKKSYVPAIVYGNKIAFIGGMTSWFVYSTMIEIYDPATNSWSYRYMDSDLYYETLFSYNNSLYSAGGLINGENTSLSGICKFEL